MTESENEITNYDSVEYTKYILCPIYDLERALLGYSAFYRGERIILEDDKGEVFADIIYRRGCYIMHILSPSSYIYCAKMTRYDGSDGEKLMLYDDNCHPIAIYDISRYKIYELVPTDEDTRALLQYPSFRDFCKRLNTN